jgi:hypothetical protein
MTKPADRQQERGMAAVFTVLGFLAVTLVVGMSTDFGILMRYRRAMQNACDSGVLAGGLNLRSSPSTAPATAQRYAEDDMRQNNIAWSSVDATTLDLMPTRPGLEGVRVEVHSNVPMFFLRLVRDTVPVAVACTARLAPVILTRGLVPLGLNYDAWRAYSGTSGCLPVIQGGVPLSARTPPCDSFTMTLDVSARSNPWGSGNTGMVAMQAPGGTGDCFADCPVGASFWRDTFIQGSPQQYCFDEGQTAAVTDFTLEGRSCANVRTRPGTVSGPVRTAVDARCDSTNPLDRIVVIVLLNPAYATAGSGSYTTEIWGFAAYELDCSQRPTAGAGNVSIHGGFVSFVSMQATGTHTTFDTGIYTVVLCEDSSPQNTCRS